MQDSIAPFRADMVGSLLRTAPLKEARAKHAKGATGFVGALRALVSLGISPAKARRGSFVISTEGRNLSQIRQVRSA